MRNDLLRLKINERGAIIVTDPKTGKQIPGINGIEIEQDLSLMKGGIAQIKLSMMVSTKDFNSIPKEEVGKKPY